MQTNDTTDSSYSADELGQYQSLSLVAVAALVLGILSPLVLITPILVIVPLAAVGLAIVALSQISASEGNLSGVGLARWGLVLAIVFGTASFTRNSLRDSLYREELTVAIEPWLDHVSQSQFDEAKKHMTFRSVKKFTTDLPVLSVVPIYRDQLITEAFAQDKAIRSILGLLRPSSLVMVEDLSFSLVDFNLIGKNPPNSRASCLYRLQNLQDDSLLLRVVLVRSPSSAPPLTWLVDSWELVRR